MKGNKLSLEFAREFKQDKRKLISSLIAEHGDAFKLKGFSYDIHFITNPEYIKYILVDNGANYVRPPNVIIDSLFLESKATDTALQDVWKEDRMNVVHASLSGQSVKKYADIFIKTTAEHLKKWESNIATQTPIATNEMFNLLTLENLSKTLFNDFPLDPDKIPYQIKTIMYVMIAYDLSLTKLPWFLPTYTRRRTKEVLRDIKNLSNDIAKYCLSDKVPEDNLLKSMAKLHADQNLESYSRTRAASLLFGGFHLIADSLTGIFIYLSLYPLIGQKVYEEVKNTIGDRELTMEDLGKLNYTKAVISEALRLSVVPPLIPRFALQDDAIGDYKIKKNDRILFPVFYLHRLPQYWVNPEGFDPDRFLNPLGEEYKYIYLPFGHGPRMCIGRNFALLQITIVIAMIMQKYRLYLVPHQTIDHDMYYEDPDLHRDAMMTMHYAK